MFNPNIPIATDDFSISAPQILGNFVSLGTMLKPDYGQINFIEQPGSQPTGVTTVGLVAKDSALTPGTTALFFVPKTGGGNPIEFTSAVKVAADHSDGYYQLPCGILIQWQYLVDLNGAHLFPKAFTNHYFNIQITVTGPGGVSKVFPSILNGSITNAGFTGISINTFDNPQVTPAFVFSIGY
jgi:hypothetical protein